MIYFVNMAGGWSSELQLVQYSSPPPLVLIKEQPFCVHLTRVASKSAWVRFTVTHHYVYQKSIASTRLHISLYQRLCITVCEAGNTLKKKTRLAQPVTLAYDSAPTDWRQINKTF